MKPKRSETALQEFWIQRAHRDKNGRLMLSWHSYATTTARDRWVAVYRKRGDRVEIHD